MRQGDGTDLLGANDPRSASIGIIRVDPTDARQDVLTAILAQDELKRRQIAIVLHEQNRAFQSPVDFDGLKDMRRRLNAELVIVALSGSGPAEFARQRRFPVYSSLESYASALREEIPEGEVKRGWFGRRQKSAPLAVAAGNKTGAASAEGAEGLERPQSVPAGAPLAVPAAYLNGAEQAREEDEEDEEDDVPTLVSQQNGAVGAGGAAGGLALSKSLLDNDDDVLAPAPSQPATNGRAADPAFNAADEERPERAGKPSHTPPALRAVEPGIITLASLKPRPKSTGKLPAIEDEEEPPPKNGNTGKQRAVLAGASGAAMAAGASAFASPRSPYASTGAPPSGGSAGAPVGTSGGPPRRRSRRWLAILLVLLTLLLLVGIALASPIGQHILPGPTTTATVTITPKSQDVANNYLITAVTGTPNPSARQVQARIIQVTSSSRSASANATGSIAGRKATGTLTFINTNLQSVSIGGGVLRGKSGVPIAFSGLTVPPGSVNWPGVAVNAGTAGDIPALDIAGPCCASGILVRNFSAFGGGVNPQPNMVITQNDITRATNNLIALVKPQAQSQLKGKVKANEDVVTSSLNCTANVSADHKAGDIAKKVTVTGTATCSEVGYDLRGPNGAKNLAEKALSAQAATNPGPAYMPVGIVSGVVKVMGSKPPVYLTVHAEGVWVYQFSDALKQQLANAIANKSKSVAMTYLLAQQGVQDVSISISNGGNTLPSASNITIIIKAVAGPTGTPTLAPGSPVPSSPGITPTPQNGQGGS